MSAPGNVPAVRRLAATDLEALAALHRRSFPHDPWNRRALAEILAMPGAGGWLALDVAGRPLGFLLVRRAADEAEVLSLGVDPERRREGIGGRLLDAGLESLAAEGTARLFLEVAVDNPEAQALYRARGFVEVGRRPAYLSGPDGPRDALVMVRRLGD
ncbi:[SSU ribosomal protein S18P]-alanine acetyltransferase [Tistlia consotensis]|uniref:Ribosomal-protein-alanine N-acetyltransferase n=1 Tax=Tistlia consotensis USBA 355 TaxID=560819 RepID=A0A1Y6CLM7_9PROT|nr:ribosomal protein S18-alanine N-acetyltransferase [Tistlia consotensis]SMF74398.1 ribosomal-protein-alanine N-acetyltransferase [Tistlia consotensis USBA 355]SNS10510.1 [SSU ribosomal protein S18P]-alanine acetyltransferase [Tistlia consotensis]